MIEPGFERCPPTVEKRANGTAVSSGLSVSHPISGLTLTGIDADGSCRKMIYAEASCNPCNLPFTDIEYTYDKVVPG